MTDVTCRTATLSDLDVVFNFSLQLQHFLEKTNPTIWKITEEGAENKRQSIKEMLTSHDEHIIVAETKNKVIGFISGFIRKRDDYTPKILGQIGGIFIIESFRRQGVGTRLLKELLIFFEEQQVERIVVNYIVGNDVGEAFWNNFDFKPVHISSNIPIHKFKTKLNQ